MRAFLLSLVLLASVLPASAEDPFLWLEEVEGPRALEWVKSHNHKTLTEMQADPQFQSIYDKALKTLDSEEKLLEPHLVGNSVYNFWRDQKHVRGILRRLPLEKFVRHQLEWETVLDLDALATREKENWVYGGIDFLEPDHQRALLWLSRGGSDAKVMREFDVVAKDFVAGGFTLPEAKSDATWEDRDTLYVGTDFGPGTTSVSGYPRVCKLWKRGTPLSEARTVLEVPSAHLGIDIFTVRRPKEAYDIVYDNIDFYSSTKYLRRGGQLRALDIPKDASLYTLFQGRAVIELRTAWKNFPQGALLGVSVEDGSVSEIFHPSPGATIQSVNDTRDDLVVVVAENVTTQAFRYRPEGQGWRRAPIDLGAGGQSACIASSADRSDFFLTHQDFLSPTALYHVDDQGTHKLQQLPASFDASKFDVHQSWAISKDGTRVPYYVVAPKDLKLDGSHPTLLYGYGGFQVSILPDYLNLIGPAWLERGGIYVSANIRGGGEFGPAWHQAALREKRPRAYEDFEAVAEDIIRRGITSPRHLGIHGRSNGGLLMGAELTRRPDLFGAVLCGVPLLDMQRYNKLLAGASWVAEYGDPDKPEDWAFIQKYSPYHNLKAGVKYPKPLIYTSTKDDRVHPGHARKMTAKMESMGLPVYYYENLEGGHAGVTNNAQRAFVTALSYTYLARALR